MKIKKTLLPLFLLFVMPLCAQNGPSENTWSKYSPAAWYSYLLGKPQIPNPAEPVGLQLIPQIAPSKLLRTINILSKLPPELMHKILEKTNNEELINIYKTVNVLKYQHKREENEPGYPRRGSDQQLQKQLFTTTHGTDVKGNPVIHDAPGFLIQYEAQREGRNRLAKILNCTPTSLQDGTCQPIIKNPEEIYTKEERRLNFLKRLLQELQKEVAPTSKGFNWIIDFNWLSTLENFSNIDIKYSQFQNQDIVNFDFNRFTQEMNQQQEKIKKVLSSIKSDFGSVKSTKISIIDAMGDRKRVGFRCDVKSTTIIELPNKETRELVITPSCSATHGFDFSIKPINATEFSTGFDYGINPQEKNLANLSLPSKNICDPAEKVALHCALEYAKLVGVHALKTTDVSGFYQKAPPYCRIKLLKEMGFQYIGQREIQGDAYTNESVYQISLTE